MANSGPLSDSTSFGSPHLKTKFEADALETSMSTSIPLVFFSGTTGVSLVKRSAITRGSAAGLRLEQRT